MLWTIAGVFIFCLLVVVYCYLYSSEEFPECYNPVCFDCNKGGETCKTCKFLDPEYRGTKDEIMEATNYRVKL